MNGGAARARPSSFGTSSATLVFTPDRLRGRQGRACGQKGVSGQDRRSPVPRARHSPDRVRSGRRPAERRASPSRDRRLVARGPDAVDRGRRRRSACSSSRRGRMRSRCSRPPSQSCAAEPRPRESDAVVRGRAADGDRVRAAAVARPGTRGSPGPDRTSTRCGSRRRTVTSAATDRRASSESPFSRSCSRRRETLTERVGVAPARPARRRSLGARRRPASLALPRSSRARGRRCSPRPRPRLSRSQPAQSLLVSPG